MSQTRTFLEGLFPAILTAGELSHPFAIAMEELLASAAYGAGRLIECRGGNEKDPTANLLVVDLDVDLGQRPPVNDIRPVERVAIACIGTRYVPSVCPFRDDFPEDLPHFHLATEEGCRSLCLFEMPTEEALRITTPFVLLERTRFWLAETAHARLHGEDQPLDPLFVDSGNPIVLPPVDEMSTGSGIYRAFISSKHKTAPAILLKAEHVGAGQALVGKGLSGVVIVTKALPHARIRALPGDVAELLTQYRELGVDLLNPLRDHFKSWIGNQFINQLLAQQCVVVIRTPIERTPGIVGGEAAKAFLTECTAEQLADKLGALWRQDDTIGSVLLPSPPDMDALRTLTLHPMDVHRPFDRAMAQAASGIAGDAEHARAITLVGAGALGSQMVMTAARMGMGRWTIVDDDHILPHNLGRYALTRRYLGWAKAEAVAREIKLLLGVGSATAVVGRIDDGETGAVSLATAELVIDASASVPVARWLATASTHVGRTISVFVNPTGHDLVVLAEGADRMPRLDHVEMSYYWMLVTTPSLMGHLSGGGVGLYPSGGCRQASLRLSQADMATLAATAAKRAVEATPPTEGTIEIWRTGDDGVTVERARPTLFRDIELAGWKVSFSELVLQGIRDERVSAGGEETGGILIGTWDRSRRRAYIVGHCSAPPDSVATRTGFVRGMVGVFKTLDEVEKSTAANLTYVGEWHTHPPGFASTPSSDDKLLLEWIEHVLIFSDVPPLMLIAGEDGVRALLGTAANSCLMPSRPPES